MNEIQCEESRVGSPQHVDRSGRLRHSARSEERTDKWEDKREQDRGPELIWWDVNLTPRHKAECRSVDTDQDGELFEDGKDVQSKRPLFVR